MTSREFNQNTSSAKNAAKHGPVFITDRGRPAHVLLTYEEYESLLGQDDLLLRLGEPDGVEAIGLTIPSFEDPARPADFS